MTRPSDAQVEAILREITENDHEFMRELISAYSGNLNEFGKEASEAVRDRNLDQLKSALHKINPTLLTLQYESEYEMLAAIKTQLTKESENQNLQLIKKVVDLVDIQLKSVSKKN